MLDAAADYWIRDTGNRVLGPVSVEVLRDLVETGRFKNVASISVDGRAWLAVAAFPGLVDLVAAPPPDAAQDRAQAKKLRVQLATLRTLADADIFEVPATSSAKVYLAAYFALAKKLHPDRVPDGFPALRAACVDVVQFVTDRINRRIRTENARPMAASRQFDGSQFVGLQRNEAGGYQATVRITRASVSMFTRHSMINLSNSGIFLPGARAPLGSQVDLLFRFIDPSRDIRTKGKVVWEGVEDKRHPTGSGVRYGRLRDDETAFILDYVSQAEA